MFCADAVKRQEKRLTVHSPNRLEECSRFTVRDLAPLSHVEGSELREGQNAQLAHAHRASVYSGSCELRSQAFLAVSPASSSLGSP